MPKNQGTITFHSLEEINKHHDARIKVIVHNKSKDSELNVHNVVAYATLGKHRYDQVVHCNESVGAGKHKEIKLIVKLPQHVHGVSNVKIGLIIPNCGHVILTGQTG